MLLSIAEIAAERSEKLRRSTLAASAPSSAVLANLLDDLADQCENQSLASDARLRLQERFVSSLPPLPHGRFLHDTSDRVTLSDVVRRREEAPCCVIHRGDRVSIVFPGLGKAGSDYSPGRVEGPSFLSPALTFVTETSLPFKVADLPGQITNDARLVLTQKLLSLGLLERASHEV